MPFHYLLVACFSLPPYTMAYEQPEWSPYGPLVTTTGGPEACVPIALDHFFSSDLLSTCGLLLLTLLPRPIDGGGSIQIIEINY